MIVLFANVLVLIAIPFLIWKKEASPLRPFFWPALAIKVAAGIFLGLLYRYYYREGDSFTYFADGVRLSSLAGNDFESYLTFLWSGDVYHPFSATLLQHDKRALFFSKLVSVFNLVSGNNYWITATFFSLISFIAAWKLARAIAEMNKRFAFPAVIAFLFFPSIVFWTSGLIKESIAMACVYFIVTIFILARQRKHISIREWLVLPVAMWILWSLKYYYLAVLLPILSTELCMHLLIRPRVKNKIVYALLWLIVFLLPAGVISIAHPNFHLSRVLQVVTDNYHAMRSFSSPEDVITFNSLEPDVASVAANAPRAIIAGIYRPFIWEASNMPKVVASLENAVIMLLSFTALYRLFTVRYRLHSLVPAMLLYVVLLCVFLTLSTPNLGTLSRYRLGFLPFLVLLLTANNPVTDAVYRFIKRKFPHLVQ